MVESARGKRPSSFPFCSDRCRMVDLGAWADGSYVVQGRQLMMDPSEGFEDPLDDLRRQAAQARGMQR